MEEIYVYTAKPEAKWIVTVKWSLYLASRRTLTIMGKKKKQNKYGIYDLRLWEGGAMPKPWRC